MGQNDHIDFDLNELIDAAIESGHLCEEGDRNAIGVARQVVHLGYESLTPKQRALFNAKIEPALKVIGSELRIQEILNMSNPD